MERYRLKNIIILILALLNAFLLVALGIRGTEEHTARRTQQQELVALFAADGMTLDPALIPADTELSAYTLLRDETLKRTLRLSGWGLFPSAPPRAAASIPTAAAMARRYSGTPAASTSPGPSPAGMQRPCAGTSAKNSPIRSRHSLWTRPAAAPPRPCGSGTARRYPTARCSSPSTAASSPPSAVPCCRIPAPPPARSSPYSPPSPP